MIFTCKACGKTMYSHAEFIEYWGHTYCHKCYDQERASHPEGEEHRETHKKEVTGVKGTVKCDVCKQAVATARANHLSPRQLTDLKVDTNNVDLLVLHSLAVSMITYDNPAGSADRPMWWICSKCLGTGFSPGYYAENIEASKQIKHLLEKESRGRGKRWWHFWR